MFSMGPARRTVIKYRIERALVEARQSCGKSETYPLLCIDKGMWRYQKIAMFRAMPCVPSRSKAIG